MLTGLNNMHNVKSEHELKQTTAAFIINKAADKSLDQFI